MLIHYSNFRLVGHFIPTFHCLQKLKPRVWKVLGIGLRGFQISLSPHPSHPIQLYIITQSLILRHVSLQLTTDAWSLKPFLTLSSVIMSVTLGSSLTKNLTFQRTLINLPVVATINFAS